MSLEAPHVTGSTKKELCKLSFHRSGGSKCVIHAAIYFASSGIDLQLFKFFFQVYFLCLVTKLIKPVGRVHCWTVYRDFIDQTKLAFL